MGREPGNSAFRVERPAAELKKTGMQKKSGGSDDRVPFSDKNAFHSNGKLTYKSGHGKEIGEKRLRKYWKPLLSRGSPRRANRSREGTFLRPPLPPSASWIAVPVLSLGTPRAAV